MGKRKRIPHVGCKYCGRLLSETPGKHELAKKSGCCVACYMERFAAPAEKAEWERSRREAQEKLTPIKIVPKGRLDVSKLTAEIRERLRKQNRWDE